MNEDEWLYNRFILAIPELRFNIKFMEFALKRGIVSEEDLRHMRDWERRQSFADKIGKKLTSGGSILERIMAVSPEIMSVSTVNFMLEGGLLGDTSTPASRADATRRANALRAVFTGQKLLRPVLSSSSSVLQRLEAVYGAGTSSFVVNFLRDVDNARIADIRNAVLFSRNGKRLTPDEAAPIKAALLQSIQRAQQLRSFISSGKIAVSIAQEAKAANDVYAAVSLVMREVLGNDKGDRLINNAIRGGLISSSKFDLLNSLRRLGYTAWTRGEKAFSYEGWQARALLIAEGVLSPEMVNALRASGYIPSWLARRIYPAVTAIRSITRGALDDYIKNARYRILPGESPIQSYARITRTTDKAILGLLQEAANDAAKAAERAAKVGTFSGKARSAQQRIVVSAVNDVMRDLWENVGHLTVFGEKQAAAIALESTDFLAKGIWKKATGERADLARAVREQARAGANAYISRQENIVQLSRRVYKNMALSSGQVEREINKALIRGLGSGDFAAIIRPMIRPDVRGGVSYAAMRLARTEINNAFHYEQIRYTREMPWVEGYKWNLSGSHPKGQKGDPCADMASKNHDGLGRGIYRKKNVPGKPHPHCLCFLTTEQMDNSAFESRLRSGAFDDYLNAASKSHVKRPDRYSEDMQTFKSEAAAVGKALLLSKVR